MNTVQIIPCESNFQLMSKSNHVVIQLEQLVI